MPVWEDALGIALALAGAEASTSYGQPCAKVAANGRPFLNLGREPGACVTRAPREEVELLLRARPDLYFLTPHYEDWQCVLVRLEPIDLDELTGRIEDSFAFAATLKPARRR